MRSARASRTIQRKRNEFTLGNFSDDQKDRVIANRKQFQAALGCESFTLVTAKQIHSDFIRSIKDENDAKTEPQEGDALIANSPQILLGIQTADCLPILIADPETKAFAAIHAGWRGTFCKHCGVNSRENETGIWFTS